MHEGLKLLDFKIDESISQIVKKKGIKSAIKSFYFRYKNLSVENFVCEIS